MEDPAGDMLPKYQSGQSMGPFPQHVATILGLVEGRTHCTLPGYEGPFYDANDIAGYLRRRGLDIPATADFVTCEIDLTGLIEDENSESGQSGSSKSLMANPIRSDSSTSWTGSPSQAGRTTEIRQIDGTLMTPMNPSVQYWDTYHKGLVSNPLDISPFLATTAHQSTASFPRPSSRCTTKRTVTISVSFLQEGESSQSV